MYDAGHILMILDIVTSAWLIDFCLKAIRSCGLTLFRPGFSSVQRKGGGGGGEGRVFRDGAAMLFLSLKTKIITILFTHPSILMFTSIYKRVKKAKI